MVSVEAIQNPLFLKGMNETDLEKLAKEVRTFLINTLSKTGGHFASNMGVVELTIALHKVFESPRDHLIFDVGHQGYVHKILTGRAKYFDTLRQTDGLSGFLKREESEHDCYEAGHSSTSIAAAAGMIFAKPHNDSIGNVIALIGDGAFNSGAALEALNFLGHYSDKNPIIILNDNEMSISKNIGHLSKILTQVRMRKTYRGLRKNTKRIIPNKLKPLSSKIEKRFKGFITGQNYFEALGYDYYGPLDGHSFKHLLRALTIAKQANKPTVLHVKTQKGKGYTPSEEDNLGSWHGIKPFNKETGEVKKAVQPTVSYSKVSANFMSHYAKSHQNFFVMSPAMTSGAELNEFQKNYPNQFIDVGIAEATSVTMGGALAMKNVKTFLSIYSTFLQRAYDQVIHDVARQNASLIIGIDRAGLVGGDGETHQGIYDIPMLSHIPNMTIAHPKDGKELIRMYQYAFNVHSGPIAIRYPRSQTEFDASDLTLPAISPSWEIMHKGNQATIVTFGDQLHPLNSLIQKKHLDITLINARFIKPMDEKVIASINTNAPILCVEESTKEGGLSQRLLHALIESNKMPLKYKTLAFDDEFIPQGDRTTMLKRYGLDPNSIITTIEKMIKDAS